jgi:tetratricopeptide (TPR) repeat protein
MRINDAWNNLAMVFHENGDFLKAEEIYNNIMDKVIEIRGEKHPQSLSIMTNRANTLMELSSFKHAHDLFEKSLTIRLKTLPADHLYLSYSYIGLGRAKVALTQIAAGKQLIEKALEIRKQKLPEDHWLLGEAIYSLAMVNYIQGQADLPTTKNACEILQKSKGQNNYLTQKCMTLLQEITEI